MSSDEAKPTAEGPVWEDCCDHTRPKDKYLGTFTHDDRKFDVYVYQDNCLSDPPDMHVCIRYGSKGSQYASPGPAKEFVVRCSGYGWPPKYREAVRLVEQWLKKEEKRDEQVAT